MGNVKKKRKTNKTIITTHQNADFDAIASMLAAQKLYPDSLVVFPRSQEKKSRDFIIKSMIYLLNMAEVTEIDFKAVTKLILVDTSQKSRIGKLADLVDKPDMEIHIYDHHPPAANDIQADYRAQGPAGATVTILTEIIQERGIDISPDEATVLCLGIFEDTGSFTFTSTTEKDFYTAAFLLSRGASLNTVSNLIAREINPQQVGLLNDMIHGVTRHKIKGIDIVITSVSTENYVPDFAFLVHKMLKMENLDVIFAIARMGNKIYIVARSNLSEVDVASLVGPLGGGGHPFAASATVRDKTLAQVEQQLLETLYSNIKSMHQAKDLMSGPPITIPPDLSCKDASKLLNRYNINAFLVVETINGNDKVLGVISRQVIEKALHHTLDQVPVREYMTTEVVSIGLDAELPEIQEIILQNKQRLLPVIDNEAVIGVITRTDLLDLLAQQSQNKPVKFPDPTQKPIQARTRNVLRFMKERLSNHLMDILKTIGEVADDNGFCAYVVGGFVRDLFLYRHNEDVDIVIEGNGIAFAKKYAKIVGARIHSYEKFGTAVIIYPDGFKIDVASARMEYYKFPAALPTVEMSSIKFDLFRRDFTINTLAIQLNPGKFGTLIDFFSAQRDIKEKVIRILHNLSFVEDPTRVFRAIRFEQRFGFSIGKLTAGLIENAIKMDFFSQTSGRRLFAELRLILGEENPTPTIIRLESFGLLNVIHPLIKVDKKIIAILNAVKKVLSWHDLLFLEEPYNKWAVYFMGLIRYCDKKTTTKICERLELPLRYKQILSNDRFEAERCLFWLEQNLSVTNSKLYKKLFRFKTESILYMMAATNKERVKRAISLYYTKLRHIKPVIKGKDLIKFGVVPGPVFREILTAVLDEKLNGTLKTKKDEIGFAKNMHYNKIEERKVIKETNL